MVINIRWQTEEAEDVFPRPSGEQGDDEWGLQDKDGRWMGSIYCPGDDTTASSDWFENKIPLRGFIYEFNWPVQWLLRRKRKLLEPMQVHKDAYILALMIALLQLADDQTNGEETEIPRRLHVILLPNVGARSLYLYSARFPRCFAARFRWPNWMSVWDREHISYASARLDGGLESCAANIGKLFTGHQL